MCKKLKLTRGFSTIDFTSNFIWSDIVLKLITQSQMRSLRKYAHILFIICVTVLAIRHISHTTQLNYIKHTFFPRSNYSNSLTIYGHPSPHVHTSPAMTPCRKGTSFAYEWLLTSVTIVLILWLSIHQSRNYVVSSFLSHFIKKFELLPVHQFLVIYTLLASRVYWFVMYIIHLDTVCVT